MKKNIIVPLVLFPFDIMVSINETDSEFLKSIKKYPPSILEDLREDGNSGILSMSACGQGRCVHLISGGQTIIRIKDKVSCPRTFGVLQHEIFHAVEFLLDHLKTPLSYNTDECYAYMIEYLTTQIYERFSLKLK